VSESRVVIVGAGFAGAAAAYFLTQAGHRDVWVVESEKIPGAHASGRNAAMARQIVTDNHIAACARESSAFIRRWAADTSEKHFRPVGALLLESARAPYTLAGAVADAETHGLPVEVLTRAQCVERVPLLKGAAFERGVFCPSDGIVDISALLNHYLDGARQNGARILFGAPVSAIETSGQKVRAILVGGERVPCDVVVNASGAWAGRVGEMAGAAALKLTPFRRHLFTTTGLPEVSPRMPFVWDVDNEFYFRPEQAGLLMSACDESASEPCAPPINDPVRDLLANKIVRCVPALREVQITSCWAGLRTIAADHRFVLGWDAAVRGLFWAAGLGGHGMTCSAAVGRATADAILSQTPVDPAFDPGRPAINE
jgi:glycine/D-amino acid oxidase-like deaminating enzyme